METSETYQVDSTPGTIKKMIMQQLQHKKDGAFIVDCSADAVDAFAMVCQELSAEFDSRNLMPAFKASTVAERFSEDTYVLTQMVFAVIEASCKLADRTDNDALWWRTELLRRACDTTSLMTDSEKIERLRDAFPDITLGWMP